MRLRDKTAIVTGAASGFGAGIAERFVADGATVVVADIDGAAAEAVAAGLARDAGRAVHACRVDVSDNDSVAALAAFSATQLGVLDILVNNAGVTHLPAAMEDVDESEFDRVLAVNAKSVYLRRAI